MPKLLGLQDVAENLLGGELNNIGNVLTLARWLRPIFDTSEFLLEEHDGEPDTYGVRATMNERSFHNATKPRRRVQLEVDPQVNAYRTANKYPRTAPP